MAVTAAFDLTPRQLDTVRALLARCLPGTGAWVYGSRARWTSRPDSDLDLVVFAKPGQARAVSDLREAFEESDLPFRVDLFVWDEVPDAFRKEIKREHVVMTGNGTMKKGWLYHPPFPAHWQPCSLYSMAGWVNGVAFRNIQFSDTGRPVIKIAEIKGGISGQTKFTHQTFDESVLVQSGDLLFSWSGQPETSIDSFWWRGPEGWLNQHVFKVTPIAKVHAKFFYYLLRYLKPHFVGIARNKQTTGLGHVTKRDLENIEAACPDFAEQRAIARVLGALDDKIELNRRMNETLEATARAIFRDWFVDFGPVRAKMEGREPYLPPGIWRLFPDALDDAGKPKGWTMGTLSDIARSPRRTISPADVFRHTPYIGLEHMPRRSIALTQWESAVKVTSDKLAFRAGEILFGKLRPYFHKVGVAPVEGICSTDIVVVVSQAPQLSAFTAVCLSSDGFVDYTDRTSTGTRMPRTSWRTMGQYRICLPSEDVAGAFQGLAQPLIDCIGANIHEASFLAQFRDLLIPKLISGQIRLRTDETSAGMDSANNRRVTAPSHDRRKPHPGRGRDVSGDGKAPCGP